MLHRKSEFIAGTDLVYVGSSFILILGDKNLSRAENPFDVPSIRHEIRWNISKENEAGHTWLRSLIIDSIMEAFKPDFQLDPTEKFVVLSDFEQLKDKNTRTLLYF